jgi:hypothetical protein
MTDNLEAEAIDNEPTKCIGDGCEASYEGDPPPDWQAPAYLWPDASTPEDAATTWMSVCVCPQCAREMRLAKPVSPKPL